MKLHEVKDLVKNQGYAIHNDDTVEKLREVLKFCFPKDTSISNGVYQYYFIHEEIKTDWNCFRFFKGNSINLSEIELETVIDNKITLEMVVDLTKKYTNDMELGSELRKLLNNTKRS